MASFDFFSPAPVANAGLQSSTAFYNPTIAPEVPPLYSTTPAPSLTGRSDASREFLDFLTSHSPLSTPFWFEDDASNAPPPRCQPTYHQYSPQQSYYTPQQSIFPNPQQVAVQRPSSRPQLLMSVIDRQDYSYYLDSTVSQGFQTPSPLPTTFALPVDNARGDHERFRHLPTKELTPPHTTPSPAIVAGYTPSFTSSEYTLPAFSPGATQTPALSDRSASPSPALSYAAIPPSSWGGAAFHSTRLKSQNSSMIQASPSNPPASTYIAPGHPPDRSFMLPQADGMAEQAQVHAYGHVPSEGFPATQAYSTLTSHYSPADALHSISTDTSPQARATGPIRSRYELANIVAYRCARRLGTLARPAWHLLKASGQPDGLEDSAAIQTTELLSRSQSQGTPSSQVLAGVIPPVPTPEPTPLPVALGHPCLDPQCKYVFSHRSSMDRHYKVNHLGLRSHECFGCGQGFARSEKRQAHWDRDTACHARDNAKVMGTELETQRKIYKNASGKRRETIAQNRAAGLVKQPASSRHGSAKKMRKLDKDGADSSTV